VKKNDNPIRIAQIMGKMNSGGVESFIMNYYRNINREKVQFDFIVDEDSLISQKEEIENLGGKIIVVPPYQHIFQYLKELKKILKNNNYKIVHSHLNSLNVFPLYSAWRAKVPVRIAHSHSTTNIKEWKKNLIKNILKIFSKIFATNYFACSEHAGRWLFGNKVFNEGKVDIIHNAIDIEKFKFNENVRNNIRKELHIEDKFVLGHVGRFVEQKNHDFLIDIFNEVYKEKKDIILLLIGEGPLEKDIKGKIKKLGLEENIKFLGVRNDVYELMQAMDCFVFPSLYEGLGMVVIEAQCADLQCIVSTEVPEATRITDLIEFVSLEVPSNVWSKCIKGKLIDKKRDSNRVINNLRNSGYDILEESKKLEKKYLDLIK